MTTNTTRSSRDFDSVVHKFGFNEEVGTTYEPIAYGGIYRTPQPASATAVRIKAGGNANDTAAGSGAREVTVQGLSATGALQTSAIATNGASASTATTETYIRIFRAWVSASGTYASQSAGSHSADIVIENSGGTEDWLTIPSTGFPRGQSEIACYSVPLGKKAFLKAVAWSVESTKVPDLLLFQRQGILDAAAPYEAMRVVQDFKAASGTSRIDFEVPIEFPELTDIGLMGVVSSGTAIVFADMEILLIDT